MPTLRPDQWKPFVLDIPRTAKLATVRKDGRPHLVPVWFDIDGNDVVFMTGAETVKGRTMRRDPRVAICIDDDRPPFSFVTIEGVASTTNDLDDVEYWARRIGARYMGDDRADEYGARNGVPGELVVRVRPDRVIGIFDVAD